jgi:hypothetical protein
LPCVRSGKASHDSPIRHPKQTLLDPTTSGAPQRSRLTFWLLASCGGGLQDELHSASSSTRKPPPSLGRLRPKGRNLLLCIAPVRSPVDRGASGRAMLRLLPDHPTLDRGRRAARSPLSSPRADLRGGSRGLSQRSSRPLLRWSLLTTIVLSWQRLAPSRANSLAANVPASAW